MRSMTATAAGLPRDHPAVAESWKLVIPFFDFAPEVRKVIYLHDEHDRSIDSELRKSTRNRGRTSPPTRPSSRCYTCAARGWAAPPSDTTPAAATSAGRQRSTTSTLCSPAGSSRPDNIDPSGTYTETLTGPRVLGVARTSRVKARTQSTPASQPGQHCPGRAPRTPAVAVDQAGRRGLRRPAARL